MKWSPHSIAILHQLMDDGLTASKIGQRFGCSRNAVIGKATREGRRFDVSFWTDSRVTQLRKLIAEGHTSLDIAQIMGNTRSAILGKAAGLKIRFRGEPGSRKPPKPAKAAAVFHHGAGAASGPEPKAPRSLSIPGPTADSLNVYMWDARFKSSGCCKWPTITDADGTHRFCCAPTSDVYCAPHGGSVYRPSQKPTPSGPKGERTRAADPAGSEDPEPLDFERAA